MRSINNVIPCVNTAVIGAVISSAHRIRAMKRKPLSPADAAAAANLRRIWDEKKKGLGLTQEKAAAALGFNTQAAVSHYLSGYTPLNTDAVLKFAALLKVQPSQIREDIVELLGPASRPGGAMPGGRKVWVIGNGQGGLPDRVWTDGDYPVGASDEYAEVATDDSHAFVVRVWGESMYPKYKAGDYALVEPSETPEIEDDVLVRLNTGETMLKRLLARRGGIRLGSYGTAEVLTYAPDEITWIYYVSHPIPARKIKHWIEAQEYAGEERRHETAPHESERRSGYVLPELRSSERPGRTGKYVLPKPKSETEHVYGTKDAPARKRGKK